MNDAAAAVPAGSRAPARCGGCSAPSRTDPEPFYRYLAAEAVADLDRRHGPLAGQTIVDLGCGPGHYTRAFRDARARP